LEWIVETIKGEEVRISLSETVTLAFPFAGTSVFTGHCNSAETVLADWLLQFITGVVVVVAD